MVALVVPALIPTGYMIGKNSTSNIVEITICSAINHRKALLNLDTGQILGESDSHLLLSKTTDSPQQIPDKPTVDTCPFWLASAAFLTTDSIDAPSTPGANLTTTAILPSRLTISHPTPPLPARGPPILV